jgi:heat shock protein HtpX
MFVSIQRNKVKTVFIVLMVVFFLVTAVYFIANYFGMGMYAIPIAVVIAIGSSWSSYHYSDRIVLSISGARPAGKATERRVRDAMEGLCLAAGLPMPRVYIIDDKTANAFATGRDPYNAVVCVTTGLLEKMEYYELEAVLAHELAHIGNRDILLSTIVTVMVGIVTILSDFFLRTFLWGGRGRGGGRVSGKGHPILMVIGLIFVILAPIIGFLMRMLLSQNREYLADATAIQFTRNPDGLASALKKLSMQEYPIEKATNATSNLYIVDPFDSFSFEGGRGLAGLFSTHPPIEKRIQAIRNLK